MTVTPSISTMLDAATTEERPALVAFIAALTPDEMDKLDLAIIMRSPQQILGRVLHDQTRLKTELEYFANF